VEAPLLTASQRNGLARDACSALLIEANDGYRATIAACLTVAGCSVLHATTPELGFAALARDSVDLVVWGVSGAEASRRGEVISEIKLQTTAAIVLVDDTFDMAQFDLEAGVDQWVPKPFVPGVLIGSVRAALRKSGSSGLIPTKPIEIRGMMLDGRTRKLRVDDGETTFTRQEWNLLFILVSNPNRFLSAREILRLGWRAGDHEPDQLRTYVHRLREKMGDLELPCRLLSRHGLGYCLMFD
jgi:DNA-binding response OmpR family regulator